MRFLILGLCTLLSGLAGAQEIHNTLPFGEPCPGEFCDYYFANTHFATTIVYREYDAEHWVVEEIRSTLTSANQKINGVEDTWEAQRFQIFSGNELVYEDVSHDGHRHVEGESLHFEVSRPDGDVLIRKGDNRIEIEHEYILRDRLRRKPTEYYYPRRYVEDL